MSASSTTAQARNRHMRIGAVGIAATVLLVAAAMQIGNLPTLLGNTTSGRADFTDISGLAAGDPVVVAGIDVGRVTALAMHRGYIEVSYRLDQKPHLGDHTGAAIRVNNLLGSKELDLLPSGAGHLSGTIPVARTTPAYDLTSAFEDLTAKEEALDPAALQNALNAVATTLNGAAPDIQASLKGLAAISTSIASRDTQLDSLLNHAETLSGSLDASSANLTELLHSTQLILAELDQRKTALAGLIEHTRALGDQLAGLVADNQAQIGPALADLAKVTAQLQQRQKDLGATIRGIALFARVFVNTIGSGPWFDSYIANAPDSLKQEAP